MKGSNSMPNVNEFVQPPRKDLHVFYILDTSGSMESTTGETGGSKISTLNRAMEETIEALKTLAKSNGDAKLKIAVMEYNSTCRWITNNGPEDLEEDFEFETLKAGGLTDIGAALKELNSKLSRHAFLDSMVGALRPVIIFMTDGFATEDYATELEEIRKNRWFAKATKIGFALGDDADVKMIASVVGDSEAVIKTSDLEVFKKLMKFVSVTASMLVSSSTPTESGNTAGDIMRKADKELGLDSNVHVKLDDDEYNKEPEPSDDSNGFDDGDW